MLIKELLSEAKQKPNLLLVIKDVNDKLNDALTGMKRGDIQSFLYGAINAGLSDDKAKAVRQEYGEVREELSKLFKRVDKLQDEIYDAQQKIINS
jgi:hypothetical protein